MHSFIAHLIPNMNLLNHTLIKKLELPMSSAVSSLLSRKMGCLQRKYRDHPPCLVMDGCSAGKVILCSLDSPAQVHEKAFLGCQKILQTFNSKTKNSKMCNTEMSVKFQRISN